MSAKDLYDGLVQACGYVLAEQSFEQKGNAFYFSNAENKAIISFQKSPKTTSSEILFTLELGLFSGAIHDFMAADTTVDFPAIASCHWRKNIGAYLEVKNDDPKWWSVRHTQTQILQKEIMTILINKAIPDLKQTMTDSRLGALWFGGAAPGLTEFQRLCYLSILLKNINREKELMDVLAQLEEQFSNTDQDEMLQMHLSKIL